MRPAGKDPGAGQGGRAPAAPRTFAARRKKDLTTGAALMFLFALFVTAATVELPPARSVAASEVVGRRSDTAEVAGPPSVAERTTNLPGQK